MFPFWRLSLTSSLVQTGSSDLRLNSAITGLALFVLFSGVVMLLRNIRRESQLNQLRADFISAVTHELKTPLTVVRLYADTLSGTQNLSESQRRGFLRAIAHQSEQLGRLIENVLECSRIERGCRQYEFQETELAPLIARMLDSYKPYWESQGFAIEPDLDFELPPVRADAGAVSRAVFNLVDNAIKYSGDSRRVTVRLRHRAGQAALEVEDRGIGIPAAEQGRVFDRFYRVRNAAGKGGYGIGLYIVRHVAAAHGGRVEVESEPGNGSLFRLVFPLCIES